MLQQFYPQPVPHDYKYELNKDMNFSAAHYIPHIDAGACAAVHGHTYFVNITVGGNKLDHMGFLINFKELKKAVHGRYDHSLLNNRKEFANEELDNDPDVNDIPAPSTEVVAETIANIVQDLLDEDGRGAKCLQVMVRETPTSYVVYRP